LHPTDLKGALTQEHLRSLVDYDPATGIFTWRVARPNGVRLGMRAGTLHQGRRIIKIEGRGYLASRLAFLWMTGAWPPAMLDHRDLDKTNDTWANLRPATRAQNNANRPVQQGKAVPLKGVSLSRGRYQATIRVDGRHIFLGRFATPEAAHAAYASAAEHHFGSYARVA